MTDTTQDGRLYTAELLRAAATALSRVNIRGLDAGVLDLRKTRIDNPLFTRAVLEYQTQFERGHGVSWNLTEGHCVLLYLLMTRTSNPKPRGAHVNAAESCSLARHCVQKSVT